MPLPQTSVPNRNGAASQSRTRAGRLDTVDGLRAFAAIGVVLTHIGHHDAVESKARRLLLLPFDFGYVGVPCFLVISGFCIHLAASARPGGIRIQPNWGTFWKRRMYRLYPAYIAAASLSYAVYRCLPPSRYSSINQVHSIGYDAATHALMFHNLFERFPFSLGNGVFWTLGLEEQLYALYAIYVVFRRRHSAVTLASLALAISLLWRFAIVVPFGSRGLGSGPLSLGSWWTWPFGWWFSWIVGAVAAEAYVGGVRLPRGCFSLRVAALFAVVGVLFSQLTLGQLGYSRFIQSELGHSATWLVVFQMLPQCSDLAFAACFFVCINYLVREERSRAVSAYWHRFAKIGRMSYSLYLTHVPVLMLLEPLLPSARSLAGIAIRYGVLVPACVAFGGLYFWAVERHFFVRKNTPVRLVNS